MDNQLFPGGTYLDDLPQVCTLCGIVCNNAIGLQHHMQLHILTATATASQLLGNQSAEAALGLTPAPNILDLVAGAGQHVVPGAGAQHVAGGATGQHVVVPGSSTASSLIQAQALFTANTVAAAAANVPAHLISQSLGSVPSLLQSPIPQKVKEKKTKTSQSKGSGLASSTSSTAQTSAPPASIRSSTVRSHQSRESRDSSISTFISSFATDLQKVDLTSPVKSTAAQLSSSKEDLESFLPSLSQMDPIEEALKVPTYTKVSQYERQSSSSKALSSSHSTQNKDSKLFQPFVTIEEPSGLPFMSKTNSNFTADSLLSPMKIGSEKPLDLDILSTPQKPSFSSLQGNESQSSSPKSLTSVPITTDLRSFGRGKSDSSNFNQIGDKIKDLTSTKVSQSVVEGMPVKPPFFPGFMDPMNVSPKSSQVFRDSKNVTLPQKVLQVPGYISSSSSSPDLKTSISIANEPPGVPKDPTVAMLSPKISMDMTNTSVASSVTASKPPIFGVGEEIPKGLGQAFGGSKSSSQASAAPVMMNPAIGMPDVSNPLGASTGGPVYFNALTQKLLNPGMSIGTEFGKPNSSSFNYGSDSQGQKGKSYYENGILINQDYDRISDNDSEEDLAQMIDDIDTKDDTIDSKDYTACPEIEDLLNEFNEKHPEDLSKTKTQMDDFLLNDVLNEDIVRIKNDEKPDDPVPSAEHMAMNQLAISELLEKEKEIIEKESKMLESARLNATSSVASTDSSDESTPSTSTQSTAPTAPNPEKASSAAAAAAAATSTDSKTAGQRSDHREEDPTDFEIPKVGKLMKIRKYFQIQEQKKKEKTQIDSSEANAEVKIQIREKAPIEEKPQTILVQVSKRKKIEYGPYINRQSLLEGKPKEPEQESSAPKLFRPKPKPQIPTRRTFNLRTRKTKTDFASLANKGSRTGDAKKVNEKTKEENANDTTEIEEEEEEEEEIGDLRESNEKEEESTETGITTRNKDKSKKESENGQTQTNQTIKTRGSVKETQNTPEKDTAKDDGKPNLRTRANKADNDEKSSDSKTLRKRSIRTLADSTKAKCMKTDVKSTKVEQEERSLRLSLRNKEIKEQKDVKDIRKKTSDKTEIKMCSVNLGDKITNVRNIKKPKIKQSADTKPFIDTVGETKSKEVTEEKHVEPVEEDQLKESDIFSTETAEKEEEKPIEVITCDVHEENENLEIVNNEKMDSEPVSNNETFDEIPKAEEVIACEPKVCEPIVSEPQVKPHVEQDVVIVPKEVKFETKRDEIDMDTSSKKSGSSDKDFGNDIVQTIPIISENENKPISVEPVREKLTMKIKLGASFKNFMRDLVPKVKKRKSDNSPKLDTYVTEESTPYQSTYEKITEFVKNSPKANDSPDGSTFDTSVTMLEKKAKDSVENEFQRLVDQAMAEVKNAQNNETGKKERYVNLRKRLNDGVKYNVDDSDDDLEPVPDFMLQTDRMIPKFGKSGPGLKGLKLGGKGPSKLGLASKFSTIDSKPKKDMDIYDFTDTEMSDKEDSTPAKPLSFKPKYVSNLNLFGQNKSPFVAKPVSPTVDTEEEKIESENDKDGSEISYVGKTVEPLKIKLTKIIPYKEKKHKHKKKKRKRDKERKHYENKERSENFTGILDIKDSESKTSDHADIDTDSNEGVDEEHESAFVRTAKKSQKLKEKKHICCFCNQGFGQKCDLRKHLMIHTGERPWPCEICDKKFQRKTDLVKHTRTHTGEKPYACEFCDKRVSDKSQLSVHRRLHTGDRPYQCTKCGKRCITSSELTRHRSVHCSEKNHQCEICKKTFKIKECLGMHMKMHYRSKAKLFQCDKCAVGFDRKLDMDKHSCALWNTCSFKCSECYEEFMDELLYAEHIKTHDLGVFACNMCTNMFEDKHSLETHLCSMGMDKQKQFQCEICDEIYFDESGLSQHMPIHDNDTGTFMCDLCPEIFIIRKELIQHVKRHLEEKSFENSGGVCGGGPMNSLNSVVTTGVPDGMYKTGRTRGAESSEIDLMTRYRAVRGKAERVSVISNNFRQMDNSAMVKREMGSDMCAGNIFDKTGKANGRAVPVKTDILSSDKMFEASDFTNSPDFSSLTDEPDLCLNPFEKLNATAEPVGQENKVNTKLPSGGVMAHSENLGYGFSGSLKADMKSSKTFSSVTSNIHSSPDSAQASQDYPWSGSWSANDYVNSLLNKMASGHSNPTPSIDKNTFIKRENHEHDISKTSGILSPSSRAEIFKDNIENRSKSDFLADFDFPIGQKPETFHGSVQSRSMSQQKYNNSSGARENTAFQGIDQNSYNLTRNRHFPETSSFSNNFMSGFQQNSIYNTGNSNLFGAGGSDIINKRGSSSNIFGGSQDMLQSNFYLSVEDSMKGTSPNDKTDETTALLSNFDYGIN